MNNNLTEIVFLLDRSGSMQNLVLDTIGGYNSFINEQKLEDSSANLTTILFDDKYEILHDCVDITQVADLTLNEYCARGSTALLDALGKAINTVGERLNLTKEEDRPSKVIFVITTDGEENASREFTQPMIKEMIERQTNEYNWQFLFLGANIDAVSTGAGYGILNACNYTANSWGTQSVYSGLSKSITKFRANGEIQANWNEDIR